MHRECRLAANEQHGTWAGVRQHENHGEPLCEACKEARDIHDRERKGRRFDSTCLDCGKPAYQGRQPDRLVLCAECRKDSPIKGHPLYGIWVGMISRCYYPCTDGYKNYGGRGIEVHWETAREFLRWVDANLGPKPPGCSLDRIDPDGHYESGNLRWATRQEQMANTRKANAARLAAEVWRKVTPLHIASENSNAAGWRHLQAGMLAAREPPCERLAAPPQPAALEVALERLNPPSLVPTSQSGGNTIADRPDLAMTAPGSESVNPVPDVTDNVPNPHGTPYQATNRVHGAGEGYAPESPSWKGVDGSEPGPKPWVEK